MIVYFKYLRTSFANAKLLGIAVVYELIKGKLIVGVRLHSSFKNHLISINYIGKNSSLPWFQLNTVYMVRFSLTGEHKFVISLV
jgi:hypothetical protein